MLVTAFVAQLNVLRCAAFAFAVLGFYLPPSHTLLAPPSSFLSLSASLLVPFSTCLAAQLMTQSSLPALAVCFGRG